MSSEPREIPEVAAWEERIKRLRAENRRLRREGLWVGGPRDLLGVIGRNRDELTHSALVAWLLDPGMRHGFGAKLLERCLERCFPGEQLEDLEDARSQTEVTRGSGRIDIVVWGVDFTLVVENKVDALEGKDQCDYYYREFSQEPRPLFVFLTPDGREPSSASLEAAEAYRTLSYRDFAKDLEAVLETTSSSRGAEARSAAEGYLATLRREFPAVD